MKKTLAFISLFFISCLLSSCPGEITTTIVTIKTVRVFTFSFDENGIFPHLEGYNRNELGLAVVPDLTEERIANSEQVFSAGYAAYARNNPNEVIYTNTIDSISVITLYDFNESHSAGSNVKDILLNLDDFGETFELPEGNIDSGILKFSSVPQKDSLQFEITGRITNVGNFKQKTELIILKD